MEGLGFRVQTSGSRFWSLLGGLGRWSFSTCRCFVSDLARRSRLCRNSTDFHDGCIGSFMGLSLCMIWALCCFSEVWAFYVASQRYVYGYWG